jgi:magnesium-transporting ATPase (P-type)
MVLILLAPAVPFDPIIQAFPLIIVFSISAIREAVEDIFHFRSDQRINSALSHRCQRSGFFVCHWSNLLLGDLIRVDRNEQIPADLIVLDSPDKDGIA